MNKKFEAKIYTLTDFDNNVFYVGCTTVGLKQRLQQHLSSCNSYDSWSNSLKVQKIRSLNFRVRINELETVVVFATNRRCASRKAEVYERRWIKKFEGMGIELCNCSFTTNEKVKGNTKILASA